MKGRRIGQWVKLTGHFKRMFSRKWLVYIIFLVSSITTLIMILTFGSQRQMNEEEHINYFMDIMKMRNHDLIVNTTYCTIPDFDTWDSSIYQFFKIEKPNEVCSETSYNWSSIQSNVLTILAENMKRDGYTFYPGFCCYRIITRTQQSDDNYDKQADSRVEISDECISLHEERTEITAEFVIVECASRIRRLARFTVTYRAFHGSAVTGAEKNPNVKEKISYWGRKATTSSIPPNVLVVGVDSTSRLNFRRFMPKTLSLMKQIGAVEMMGYTKVGENTFPNFMPIMNGYSEEDLVNICYSQRYVKQDDCPSVWKRFDRAKYLTAHVEDSPDYAIFHYLKTGFVKQPVDFYSRPLFLAASQYAGIFKSLKTDHLDCLGHFTNDEMILSYLETVVDLGKSNGSPVFATSWSTTVSHDSMNGIQLLDATYSEFFDRINRKGILENTILIFMGDHGYRFGKVRETLLGFYEDKLPNMWIYLPPKIKKQIPQWEKNLQMNARRLSSPFFLYWTYNQILQTFSSLPSPEDAKNEKTHEIVKRKHRYSFLEEIPESVSCQEVGVPSEFCACNPLRLVNLDDVYLLQVAHKAVENINSKILVGSPCLPLKVSKVISGAAKVDKRGEVERYIVDFVTVPGDFVIEAEMDFLRSNKSFVNELSTQRANKITQQHIACINDAVKELYCYCPQG